MFRIVQFLPDGRHLVLSTGNLLWHPDWIVSEATFPDAASAQARIDEIKAVFPNRHLIPQKMKED